MPGSKLDRFVCVTGFDNVSTKMDQMRARSSLLMALTRGLFVAAVTVFYLAVRWWRVRGADPAQRRRLTGSVFRLWAQAVCRLLGIRLRISGPPPPAGALIVPNHQGYLDVPALAAAAPMVFVSKAEVNGWPIFGFLLRSVDTLYIHRDRSRRLLESTRGIAERLREGQSVCVFLEGTTSSGRDVLRFHPSLLQCALDTGAPVVPTGVNWTATRPDVDPEQDIAYWGGHHFLKHLVRALGLGGLQAEIRFGAAGSLGGDRSREAERLRGEVRRLRNSPPRAVETDSRNNQKSPVVA